MTSLPLVGSPSIVQIKIKLRCCTCYSYYDVLKFTAPANRPAFSHRNISIMQRRQLTKIPIDLVILHSTTTTTRKIIHCEGKMRRIQEYKHFKVKGRKMFVQEKFCAHLCHVMEMVAGKFFHLLQLGLYACICVHIATIKINCG